MTSMEQSPRKGEELNSPDSLREAIMDIIAEIRSLEKELAQLKIDQEKLRDMPDRAEKGSLLSEIEGKIRTALTRIHDLQSKKMELVKEGDRRFLLPNEKEETENKGTEPDLRPGATEEEDPFRSAPDSTPGWRALNR